MVDILKEFERRALEAEKKIEFLKLKLTDLENRLGGKCQDHSFFLLFFFE